MFKKALLTVALAGIITMAVSSAAYAEPMGGFGQMGQQEQMQQGMMNNVSLASSPGDIVLGNTSNSAQSLTADTENAATIVMSDENNEVKIDAAGTYIVTGTCADGNITVKKGTTGVVLILKDLDLTSTTGATVSINKNTEVKIVIEGTVKLTDAEDPTDEDSADADVADAFDGAAIKVKAGSSAVITGTGTLTIDASTCKNGIKVSDEDTPSLVIDGDLTININAANDAINSGYDLAVLSGTLNITAVDDAIHADRILTVGADGSGPVINISSCEEGLEGTVVNIFGGNITVNSDDDGINAANSDGTYSAELEFSINITGGTIRVNAGGDGLDSNGNINITGGSTTINSANMGGEAGMDYDGTCYIAEGTVNNSSGMSGSDGTPGGMGNMQGQFQQNQQQNQQQNGMGQMYGQAPSDPFASAEYALSGVASDPFASAEYALSGVASGSLGASVSTGSLSTASASSVPEDTQDTAEEAASASYGPTYSYSTPVVSTAPVYRLYNSTTGEHFFTASSEEKEALLKADWHDEGTAFSVPASSDTPVYRLYDPKTGEHLFTANPAERAEKESIGFKYEGIAWYADTANTRMVYRLKNPGVKALSVHYTASEAEKSALVAAGWICEDTGFYVR